MIINGNDLIEIQRSIIMRWIMRKSRKKKQNSFEFSKLIYLINLGFVAVVTGLSFLCVVKSGVWGISDLSPITIICTRAFTELGLHTAGYIHKAKGENVLKISRQITEEDISKIKVANAIINNSDVADEYPQG